MSLNLSLIFFPIIYRPKNNKQVFGNTVLVSEKQCKIRNDWHYLRMRLKTSLVEIEET